MPTTLELINSEKLAAELFIISGFQSLASAFKAEQVELEKQQATTTSPGKNNATVDSNQLALQ